MTIADGVQRRTAVLAAALLVTMTVATASAAGPEAGWRVEWPRTDFSRHSIDLAEIRSGGPPKDGIPSIDAPQFVPVATVENLAPTEPVIALIIDDDARAYPLRILTWHEIVNDTVGGVPVAVTYCPLCNAAIVFERTVEGRALDFGTTGKLRYSDLVMYDRQTESWWQQFMGEAIVGELTGALLPIVPARVESFARFAAAYPEGRVLVPNDPRLRQYGANPYTGYDTSTLPFLYDGDYPEGIAPMAYVVAVGGEAWSLDLLKAKTRIETEDLVLTWEPGQSSALDARVIAEGRDIGNVVVQRRIAGGLEEAVHHVTFAFVFHAFQPGGTIHE